MIERSFMKGGLVMDKTVLRKQKNMAIFKEKKGKVIVMKTYRKYFLLTVLACIMFVGSLFAGESTSASAATRKGYIIGTSNVRVYSNSGLTVGYGWIYATDEVQVITVTSRYTKVTYPISRGRYKTGYIATGNILTATGGSAYTSSGRFTTYRRNSTANPYGYADRNDRVMVLGTRGSFTQIKYPVSGGFKYGFARTSDVDKYVKGSYSGGAARIVNGTYTLVSALNNNYVADIASGDSRSGANCQLYESNGTNAQKFSFSYNSDGYYTITNVNSGKVLDCATGGNANGLNVWQYDSNLSSAQRWKLTDVGGGYYTLTCKCNGRCLDVSCGKVYNGNNIQIYESNDTASQKWKLVSTSVSNNTSVGNNTSSPVAQKLVNYEISQLGIGDYRGNNNVKYNTWYYGKTVSGSGHAWCMAFQAYCCYQITGSNNAIPKTASCTAAVNIFKNRGQFHYSRYYGGNYTPKAGDVVYYTNSSKNSSCHVGMITSAPVNGYLQTVEGNIICSDKNYKVVRFTKNAKRTINSSYVLGYATPNY